MLEQLKNSATGKLHFNTKISNYLKKFLNISYLSP